MLFVGLFFGLAAILFVTGIVKGLRDPIDFWLEAFLWWLFAAIFLVIGLVIYASIMESRMPHFQLNKRDWACTAAHEETTMVLVGKVLVPSTTTVCDQYSRQ